MRFFPPYAFYLFSSSRVWNELPSKQCVQIRHFGRPMADTIDSILLNFIHSWFRSLGISYTIRLYSGEPVVLLASMFLGFSPSKSRITRLVMSSSSLLLAEKFTNGQA